MAAGIVLQVPVRSTARAHDLVSSAAQSVALAATSKPEEAVRVRLNETYGRLPLHFEANQGQSDSRVNFLSRGGRHVLLLTPAEAILVLTTSKATAKEGVVLRMSFIGANSTPRVTGLEQLRGTANYFVGNDPTTWRSNVPTYARVRYEDLYPGIDLVYYGNQRELEYDFVVRPGADPGRIVLGFQGADRLEVDAQGDLVLHTTLGPVRQRKPVIYQQTDGVRREIAGSYVLKPLGQVGFQVAAYDVSKPLIIDPTLAYSTYLGGTGGEQGEAIAVDAAGNAYVTGTVNSGSAVTFPTTAGAFDATFGSGAEHVFVTKLDATGSTLIYSTYLGGNGFSDKGFGIAVDAAGHAYVTGTTQGDFPTTPGAFDTMYSGNTDAFVTKLNPAGNGLVYSTYLGGSAFDRGAGIALDAAGNTYVTGDTSSTNFPTTVGAFDTTRALADVFVTKLSPSGTALVYSTFMGGGGFNQGLGIAVDVAGNAYVTGSAGSGFPTTPGAFDTSFGGGQDAFVTELNASGSALVYSTYLGGSGFDEGRGIAVDSAGHAYVTGVTQSANFPTTVGAFDTALAGFTDAFVTKLNPGGATLSYSTYVGGTGSNDQLFGDQGFGIALDAAGNAYVTGQTTSADFPITAGAFDTTLGGFQDAFVTKLGPAGALVYSTYLGGGTGTSGPDVGLGIAVDTAGNAYVTGWTQSANFPTTVGAFDTTLGGTLDAFVAKISDVAVPATLTLTPAEDSNPVGTQHCVTATVRDSFGDPIAGITVRFTVTGAISTSGSATTDATGQAPFCYTGPNAPGADTITAYADTDNDSVQDAGEPGGTASKTWLAATPATLTLTPGDATNPVGTQHCVTATVRDVLANPTPGITVRFTVTGATSTSGSAITDATGQATFCYTGPNAPGADTITAYADTNNNDVQDGEPSHAATKIWIAATPATLTLTPAADTNPLGTQHCVTATVRDVFANPTPGITVRFTVTGAISTSGSATTDATGQATFCYTGPNAPGADAITAYADANNNDVQDGEPSHAATKTWGTGPPTTLMLTPPSDTNPVGTQHCVTATVKDALANATPGVTVRFTVAGSINTTRSVTANASGQATFCYTGPSLPGADAITAFADTNANGMQSTGEPTGAASKTWVLPATTGCDIRITNNGRITAANGDRATFHGRARASATAGPSGHQRYEDLGRAQRLRVESLNVQAIVCEGTTRASIYGQATINGAGSFAYRITVQDAGRGKGRDTYSILLQTGYTSGEQRLESGNVRIRRAR